MPIGDLSLNVRTDIKSLIKSTGGDDIKSVYSPEESFYSVFFPENSVSYIFDTRITLENGSFRPTRWPGSAIRCSVRSQAGVTWMCGLNGLYQYDLADDRVY